MQPGLLRARHFCLPTYRAKIFESARAHWRPQQPLGAELVFAGEGVALPFASLL